MSVGLTVTRFQSTLPRGERRPACRADGTATSFNPRSRGGSDSSSGSSVDDPWFQSTLPRGERRRKQNNIIFINDVSIHAPAGGATDSLISCTPVTGFQSTLPRGERHYGFPLVLNSEEFQSTLPRGERLPLAIFFILLPLFQSTLPRGERRVFCTLYPDSLCFNPRSRGGSDLPKTPASAIVQVSIHAPAGGATRL